MPRLTFTDASIAPLWSHLDMDVEPGEFIAILGPNGVGKSTLLSAALGIRKLTSGKVTTDGVLGLIPQQRMFNPDLAVRSRDLVELAAEQASRRRGERLSLATRKALAKETLSSIGAAGLYDRRVGTLSGGQQQLIRQAQALVSNPAFPAVRRASTEPRSSSTKGNCRTPGPTSPPAQYFRSFCDAQH